MRRVSLKCVVLSALAAFLVGVPAGRGQAPNNGADHYVQHNLTSDIAGADNLDIALVNAWGLDRSPAGPWWVNAADSGFSRGYDGAGVLIPSINPVAVPGSPTGIVFNPSIDFQLAPTKQAFYLFV